MLSIKQRSCYSFWQLRDCGSSIATRLIINSKGRYVMYADDYGVVGLQEQHYNTSKALREQFFNKDILWTGIL